MCVPLVYVQIIDSRTHKKKFLHDSLGDLYNIDFVLNFVIKAYFFCPSLQFDLGFMIFLAPLAPGFMSLLIDCNPEWVCVLEVLTVPDILGPVV